MQTFASVPQKTLNLLEKFKDQALRRYANRVKVRRRHYDFEAPYQEKTTLDNQVWLFFAWTINDDVRYEVYKEPLKH